MYDLDERLKEVGSSVVNQELFMLHEQLCCVMSNLFLEPEESYNSWNTILWLQDGFKIMSWVKYGPRHFQMKQSTMYVYYHIN